jgi:hypothetical protein
MGIRFGTIAYFEYDHVLEQLTIIFTDNHIIKYLNVSIETYTDLYNSKEPDQYFRRNIAMRHDAMLIRPKEKKK